jgi:type I restriction enzyme, S subunit
VKAGYKQTEFGLIPEPWDLKTIGELIEEHAILGHLDGNHGELYPRSHEFKSYGVPYIGANDFAEGNVTFDRCKFVSADRAAQFRKGVARDGDVLFAHNATVGPVALLRTTVSFVILSTTATYFRCNPHKLSNEYLKAAFESQLFVKQYQAVMAQSTRFQVPITAQRKLSLPVPPLPEQHAIATAVSDVNALLDAVDRLIAKKRDLKRAAMRQLLTGQTRLPGFTGVWEVKTLDEVCQKIQDGTHFSPKLGGNDYLYVTSKNIRFGTLDLSTAERISAAEHAKIYARCDVRRGDLLLTKDGANTGNAALNPLDEPFSLLSSVAMLRFDSRRHSAAFFMYQILSVYGQEQIKEMMSGNAITRLTLVKIRGLRFAVAPLQEQTAIAAVLTDIDAELAGLEQQLAKTRAIKQAMMQELLTGKTRLVSPQVTHA